MVVLNKPPDGKHKNIKDVLGQKYYIDYYQREYKWKDEHFATLIDDLQSKFLESYDENHSRDYIRNYHHYYLGSYILSNKNGQLYIIDGQQRLTSLTLLLIYLNNLQKNNNDKVNIDHLIYSEKFGKKSFNIDVDERNTIMNAIYNGKDITMIENSESVRNIKDRYEKIDEYFSENLKGKALAYFIDWLTENVDMIEITAYSDDDAYTIFETMNDRGLSLTPTDMLKGYLISNIDTDEKREKASILWKDNIYTLSEIDKEEDLNFFKAWLRAKYAITMRERKEGAHNQDFENIGTSFHKWVRENKDKVGLAKSEGFYNFIMNKLPFYCDIYKQINKNSRNFNKNFPFLFYISYVGFPLKYPLILASIKESDDKDIIATKINLVSYFIEMFIVLRKINYRTLTQSSINYTFYNTIKEIRDKSVSELTVILKRKISGIEETFEGLNELGLHKMNKYFIKFLLSRITEYIEKQSNKKSSFEEYAYSRGQDPFEIEHIWADHFEQHKEDFDNNDSFSDYRNRIGDLVLMNESINKSFSDKPYKQKVKYYYNKNLLASSLYSDCYKHDPNFIKFINSENLNFKPYEEFRKKEIEERQDLYKSICKRIWDIKNIDIIADNNTNNINRS